MIGAGLVVVVSNEQRIFVYRKPLSSLGAKEDVEIHIWWAQLIHRHLIDYILWRAPPSRMNLKLNGIKSFKGK